MILYLPDNFDPLQHLPGHLHKYADHARWLVHTIYRRRWQGKYRDDAFISLHAANLRRILPKEHYRAIIRALIQAQVLECDGIWRRGRKSLGYRLTATYRDQPFHRQEIANPRLKRKVAQERAKRHEEFTLPVHQHLYNHLTTLEIDMEAIRKRYRKPGRLLLAQMIADKQWYLSADDRGRLSTNLTSLKKTLRRYLTVKGQELVEIDVRNSQPLFLCLLLVQYYYNKGNLSSVYSFTPEEDFRQELCATKFTYAIPSNTHTPTPSPSPLRCPISLVLPELPEDVNDYIHLVQDGALYENMMRYEGLTVTDDERAKYKKTFFRMLYCRNCRYEEKAKTLLALFPNVYQVVKHLKERDYKWLPLALQHIESCIMIHRVARRMMETYPATFISTIHDCLVTLATEKTKVEQVIFEEFAQICLTPQLRAIALTV